MRPARQAIVDIYIVANETNREADVERSVKMHHMLALIDLQRPVPAPAASFDAGRPLAACSTLLSCFLSFNAVRIRATVGPWSTLNMTSTNFSLQPWTRAETQENSLKDVLARVNLERGHFRNITEASLLEEIAAEGALELSSSEDEDDQDGEESTPRGKSKPVSREELFKAKYEMLANVRVAEQEILMSLDFVSLLLSKDAPSQAQTTRSPFLKEAVPLASLGTDKWQRMAVDKAREAQDELLASNARMDGLQQSANGLLAAAGRLHDNVRKETQYWDQVLSISEKGWNVCRIPGQQHRLGVRFGFSESAPDFSRRGIAALNASVDGNIALERGIGSKPRGLYAVLRRNGTIVGASRLPKILDPEETTLEARIRYARDSLYDEELYHEMIRESRMLTSLGVGMKGSALELCSSSTTDASLRVTLDLVPLDEEHASHAESSKEEDALAEAVVIAARLLLSHAHRDRLKKRSEVPAPMSDKQKEERPTLFLLRPIMSFIMHRTALDALNAYLARAADILSASHIEFIHCPATFKLPGDVDIRSAEILANTLMRPWVSETALTIKSPEDVDLCFIFTVETTLAHGFGTTFKINVPSRSEPYCLDSIDEVIAGADAKLASALAKGLVVDLRGDWTCNEREALLIEDVGVDEESQAMWVSLDSGSQTLSLNTLVKKIAWRTDGESSDIIFWDAARELLQAHKT